MQNEKMYLVNKLFNDSSIRTVWNKEEEKYYVSVVDVVGVLSESSNARDYWYRVKKEQARKNKLNYRQFVDS